MGLKNTRVTNTVLQGPAADFSGASVENDQPPI